MALTLDNGVTIFTKTRNSRPQRILLQHNSSGSLSFSPLRPSRLVLVSATPRKLYSRTGKFDSKNKRTLNSRTTTTEEKEEKEEKEVIKKEPEISDKSASADAGIAVDDDDVDDGYFLPDLPGNEPDFWEGPQWEPLGFFVQYMWAFGIVFALIACGIAVVTYNEGATDFKETPAYKESIQSRELLDEPDSSKSDVFESNPTEEAPSLE
ncbi:hypothetical protein RJ641_009567 [Dillenia turbinata]|uniref:Uncharacterized protein n=1 Tax=Dillenia turbinata TaxID=194707 RepID=A0AAN8V801_9MAGN